MTNPLQTQTTQLRQMLFDDLNKGQTKIFEGLVVNAPINQLPEHIFRDYFLQGFAGSHPSPSWVGEWISVAGTPSAEVVIVDTVSGQELFRVPAIIASTAIMLQGKSRGRINDIFNHTGNISQNSPLKAMVFMNTALGEKGQELQPAQELDTSVRWRQIFARYGLVSPATAESQNNSGAQDMFEY